MNRSGTKVASYRIAMAFHLSRVCLEPFFWEGGVDLGSATDWTDQLCRRRPSMAGQAEHQRLPVWCDDQSSSPWLGDVLNNRGWNLIKLVEIGRAGLVRTLSPDACVIGLIRDPLGHLQSLAGSRIQKAYVVAQWHRLRREQSFPDPLPDADRWVSHELSDCARFYAAVYGRLADRREWFDVCLGYDEITANEESLHKIGGVLGQPPVPVPDSPRLGESTREAISHEASQYLAEHLSPIYHRFLG